MIRSLWLKDTSKNLLRELIAALLGTRSIAYLIDMSQSLRSLRLHTKQRARATMFGGEDPCGFALNPLATVIRGVLK